MLKTDLKILTKILADRLQSLLPRLIGSEQDSFHLIRTIIEKVGGNAVLMINLDHSKTFHRLDHSFLEAISSAAGFGPTFAV